MSGTDPHAPAWVLDVAEDVQSYRLTRLEDEMLKRGEDITDNALWRLRRSQVDSLLQSGKVLAVRTVRMGRRS
jgi:hypothetical protein